MESYLELCNYYYNKYKDSIKKSDYNYTVSYRIIYTYDKEKNVVIGIAYHINNKNEYEFSNIYIFLRNKKCLNLQMLTYPRASPWDSLFLLKPNGFI